MNKFFSYEINELKLDSLFIEYLKAYSNISNKLNYFQLNNNNKNIISPFNTHYINEKKFISFYNEPIKIYSSSNICFDEYLIFHKFFKKFNKIIKFQFQIDNVLFQKNLHTIKHLPFSQIFETQKIDLKPSLDVIFSKFKRDLKERIKQAEKNIQIKIEIYDYKNYKEGLIKEMQLLHEVVSGKKTRSDNTWKINEKMIKCKKGFILKLLINNKAISYSLFFHNNSHGITFSSCTLRKYFKIAGINHLIKWIGISYLKKKGVRYYDIGITNYLNLSGRSKITEKERNIAYFKSRFNGIKFYHLQSNELLSLENFKKLFE